MLTRFEKDAVIDRFDGWELVEFLDISIEDVLDWILSEDLLSLSAREELLEFIGYENNDEEE